MTSDQHEVPGLYLRLAALDANIEVLRGWCAANGLGLAPHIKTTMTPSVVRRQLAAGAWGVTVATARQAELGVEWGAPRVVVANEVVGAADLERLAALASSGTEVFVLVDSAEGVRAADAHAAADDPAHRLRLLVDVGVRGGRTGVRRADEAVAVAEAVAGRPGLRLAGVGGYEGVRPSHREQANLDDVRAHCDAVLDVLERVRPLVDAGPAVFTMGGSAFPDQVADAVAAHRSGGAEPFEAVVRSGCYVTHDHGTYARVTPFPDLTPALHVRARVLSCPEPGTAVVGAGRRELAFDAGLPVLLSATADDGTPRPGAAGTATAIYDHHLVLTDAAGLTVGDVVRLGISHPCSVFDRWPGLTVLDADDRPVEHWEIRFR